MTKCVKIRGFESSKLLTYSFTGTVNPEDLEEAEESEAVAGLVDRNHANWVSQISPSGSSSFSSSTIVMDNYCTGTIRTGMTGTDLTDPIQMILINEFGNSLGFLSLL